MPPFDTVLCLALVVLTVAVDHYYNEVDGPDLQPLPAPKEGSVNLLTVSGAAMNLPSVDAGLGMGLTYQQSTFVHLESDTYATASCLCSGPSTPDLGASYVQIGLGRTEAAEASVAAGGLSKMTALEVGPFGYTHQTAVGTLGSLEDGPGTSLDALSFNLSAAPVSAYSQACQCSVIDYGDLADLPNIPLRTAVRLIDWIHDQAPR